MLHAWAELGPADCTLCRRRRGQGRPRPLARPMLTVGLMKDFVFVAVTVAFFAVSWVYAKSFDHL